MSEPMIQTREVTHEAGGVSCRHTLFHDARTAHLGRRPAVVVFPEFWGLNAYSRSRARMLAEQGYVALAADVYGDGASVNTASEASAQMTVLMRDPALTAARVQGALAALTNQPEADPARAAAIGYCMGGALALRAARLGMDVKAVASFHGILDTPVRAAQGVVRAEILVCHGAADPFVSADSLAAFKAEMEAARVPYRIDAYPGTLHGFTEPEADARAKAFNLPLAYSAKADRASWAAMLTLFSRVLDG